MPDQKGFFYIDHAEYLQYIESNEQEWKRIDINYDKMEKMINNTLEVSIGLDMKPIRSKMNLA